MFITFSWKKISLQLLFLVFIFSCNTTSRNETENFDQFIETLELGSYELALIIHINPNDCMSCMTFLEKIPVLQERIKAAGDNTFVALTAQNSDAFWEIYKAYKLETSFIPADEFNQFNWPHTDETPFFYFIDLNKKRFIFLDKLPKDMITISAIFTLVEKYSGVYL